MPKVVSYQQKRANHRNAQASTGPRSPEGKRRVACNALKHGLRAQDLVLTGPHGTEDPAEFEALLTQFHEDLQPANILEQVLVERIATSHWRLRRAQRFEAAAFRQSLDAQKSAADPVPKTAYKLHQMQNLLADTQRLLTQFTQPNPEDPGAAARLRHFLETYAWGNDLHNVDWNQPEMRARMLEHLQKCVTKFTKEVELLRADLQDAQRTAPARAQLRSRLHSIPDEADLNRLLRYEGMLDRNFHRAISELRRLRQATRNSPSPDPTRDSAARSCATRSSCEIPISHASRGIPTPPQPADEEPAVSRTKPHDCAKQTHVEATPKPNEEPTPPKTPGAENTIEAPRPRSCKIPISRTPQAQSQISNPQSSIPNSQSQIRNPQFAIAPNKPTLKPRRNPRAPRTPFVRDSLPLRARLPSRADPSPNVRFQIPNPQFAIAPNKPTLKLRRNQRAEKKSKGKHPGPAQFQAPWTSPARQVR